MGGTTPGTQYDQVEVDGNVSLAGELNVSFTNGFTSTAGQAFTIIKNDSSNPVSGTFAGLAEGAFITVGGRQFQISYTGGDGNDVTLTDDPYVVTNTNDSGVGSLREAIIEADANPGAHTITFDIPGSGVQVITPLSALPAITNAVTIDATTQPGYAGTPLVEIDEANAGSGSADGLLVGGDQNSLTDEIANTTIRGLDIAGFSGAGIDIQGWYASATQKTTGLAIEDCYIGVDASGNIAQANQDGITATGVDGIQIAQNVISGNVARGVFMNSVDDIVITGNRVGTNAVGSAAVGNGGEGISLTNVVNCTIGGTNPGDRNVISGNLGTVYSGESGSAGNGIYLGSTYNVVIQGNLIGTDVTGTSALGNAGDGISAVFIFGDLTVGGTTAAARNIISGNHSYGVALGEIYAPAIVEGNYIGTNAAGTAALGNQAGVFAAGHGMNQIGGTVTGAENPISGNAIGVDMRNSGNVVEGNRIGTDATGTFAIGNSFAGIYLADSASNNLIGGGIAGAGNLISGNGNGIYINGGNGGNSIQGNLIGTDITGTANVGNQSGVVIAGAGDSIGKTGDGNNDASERNIISGNSAHGIYLAGVNAHDTTVAGNYIGTDITGSVPLANAIGIQVDGGAPEISSARTATAPDNVGERNIIGASTGDGIKIDAAEDIVIAGNYIGTDVTGTYAFSVGGDGIDVIDNSTGICIGSNGHGIGDAAEGISSAANTPNGLIYFGNATNSVIAGNYIGLDATGTSAIATDYVGIWLVNSSGIRVGTNGDGVADATERNVLGAATGDGIAIEQSQSIAVAGNYVGTDVTGDTGVLCSRIGNRRFQLDSNLHRDQW